MVDTNVLARFVDEGSQHHTEAARALELLRDERHLLVFNAQIKREFLSLTERKVGAGLGNNGLGLTKEIASEWIATFKIAFEYRSDSKRVDAIFDRLHSIYGGGKRVYDLNIVASMLAYEIKGLLTFNDQDFRRLTADGINVYTPAEVIQSAGRIDT